MCGGDICDESERLSNILSSKTDGEDCLRKQQSHQQRQAIGKHRHVYETVVIQFGGTALIGVDN